MVCLVVGQMIEAFKNYSNPKLALLQPVGMVVVFFLNEIVCHHH